MTELSTSELNELRDRYLRLTVEPTIRWVFEKFQHVQSVTLRVAQYWDDEANDAVHAELIFSQLETPRQKTNAGENFPTTPVLDLGCEAPWSWWKYNNLDTGEYNDSVGWSDNWMAIPLFAAWCEEGCNQGMEHDEAYSPYCTYRKTDAGVQRELYPMVRDYLDGVAPEWSDGKHNVFGELREITKTVPPSIIGENIPLGPVTDEIRRKLDVCGHLKSHFYGVAGGEAIMEPYSCSTLRMQAGKCGWKNCPFKKEGK